MALEFEVDLKDGMTAPANSMADAIGGLNKVMGGGGLSSVLDGIMPGLGEFADNIMSGVKAVGGLIAAGAQLAISSVQDAALLQSKFGAPTVAMFDELGAKIGQTREQVGQMADRFKAMGITDVPQLRAALLATASANALVTGGGQAYETLASKIQEAVVAHGQLKVKGDAAIAALSKTGANIIDVAKNMGISTETLRNQLKAGTVDAGKFGDALQQALITKGAGPLGVMANSMSALGDRLKENIGKLFEDAGPGVTEFMDALKDLFSVFDTGNDSGKTLKAGLSGAFSAILSAAAKVLPYIKYGFQQLIIWGLKLYIALKPHFEQIKTVLKGIGIGILLMGAIAVAIGAVVIAPFVLMAAAGMALWAVIGFVIDKFVQVEQAIDNFVAGAAKSFADWVSGASTTAKAFVDGLVQGITNAIPNLIAAVGGMVTAAKNKVKSMLGISSPSKVMAEMGHHTAVGMAAGITGGTDKVADAAGGLADAASASASPSSSATASKAPSSSGGALTVDVGGIHIDGSGKTAGAIVEELVATLFERIALARGV